MRVTNQMFFQNLQYNSRRTMADFYKTNEQISSKQKIQYSHEDSSIFSDTMRLDYEITTLEQVKKTTSKAQTFANNTDEAMKQFTTHFHNLKQKVIQAANSTNSSTSLDAIANELQALKTNIMQVANTSINGQYIFSGTDMQQKPINIEGNYLGNNEELRTVVGAGVHLPYNVPGRDLFIGRDREYNKIIKTNIKLTNQLTPKDVKYINSKNTIKEAIGDFEKDTVFYLQGRKTNGETFAKRFSISPTSKVSDLLEKIGQEYGNTSNNKLVDVTMNKDGQIIIKDLKKGNGTLDFHLIAATDKTAGAGTTGAAEVDNPSTLTSNPNIKITNFINSNYKDLSGNDTKPSDYDKIRFKKNGNQVTGTVSQVIKQNGHYATSITKLSEVAGKSLDGKNFQLGGIDKNGNAYSATINFANGGSTFTLGGNTYNIFDKNGNATPADEVTYQQLNDIIGMVTTNTLPATTTSDADYQTAIKNSRNTVEVTMDYKGRINILDRNNSQSKIDVSLYDNSHASGAFASGGSDGSVLSFAANNAIIEDEPYIDIFHDLDTIIQAIRSGKNEADGTKGNARNPGMQAALKKIDHISDHFTKRHTKIGSLSNALKDANDRVVLLSLNVEAIQSEVIDTDLVEASLKLTQLSITYQSMLQSMAKINSLSLANYI